MKKSLVIFGVLVLAASMPALAQDFTHPATGTSNFSVTGTHNFFDSGGADCDGTGGQYTNSEDGVSVICPSTGPGSAMRASARMQVRNGSGLDTVRFLP